MPHTLQLAALQFSPGKGEYEGNLARLGGIFTQLDSLDPRPDVLHLPESALTGYFLEGGVREQAHTAGAFAADLQRVYLASGASQPLEVAIGFYELWNSILYNSAMWVRLGGDAPLIRHVHRKNFLPTYGLFDEERFVERGHDIRAFETPWGKFAMLVCEDAWHSLPGTLLALDGATMIFILAAAPARGVHPRDDAIPGPASVARWERLVRDIAEEQGVFVSFANLVANEGGKSFPGGATIAGPNGEVRVRGPLWREALVALRIDLNDLSRARSEMPLLADLQTAMPHLLDNLEQIRAETPAALEYDPAPAAKKTVAKKSRAKAESRSSDIEVVRAGLSLLETGFPMLDLLALAREHNASTHVIAEQAVALFDRYVRTPLRDTDLSDDALYWAGECWSAQKKPREAITSFDKLFRTYPQSDKAPAAHLKKGIAHLELGEKAQAMVELNFVVNQFPGSDEAKSARQRLKSLGGDSR